MLTEQRSCFMRDDKCLQYDDFAWIDNEYESFILYLILLV
ncbi:hypothetical protein C1A50_4618 [Paenibacillus polymyxa]|nr:hypothetical protein C1A50_4618 [Paenibacillus polymyxa]